MSAFWGCERRRRCFTARGRLVAAATGVWSLALTFATAAAATPALPAAATTTDHDDDDPATRARFDQGLDRLREGDASEAAALLDPVAAAARMAERRAAAAALVAYARRLERLRGAHPGASAAADLSDGRTEFVVSSTVASLYAGVVLIDVLDLDDDVRPVVGTLMLTTGAGFAAALIGSRGMGLRVADGEAYTLGLVWGAASAGLVAAATELEDSESVQLTLLGGVVVGGAAGLTLARAWQPTRGQVGVVSNGMILGVGSALLGTVIVNDSLTRWSQLPTIWFTGLQVGTVAGVLLAPELDWSASRSRLVNLGAGLGALVCWGLTALATGTDGDGERLSKLWAGAALGGLWAGAATAVWLTDDMAPDPLYRAPPATTWLVPGRVGSAPGLVWGGTF